jgi:hypothetical protein
MAACSSGRDPGLISRLYGRRPCRYAHATMGATRSVAGLPAAALQSADTQLGGFIPMEGTCDPTSGPPGSTFTPP